jgi:TolB-like protein
MADESYVQVAPDSSGKKIRNLKMSIIGADGVVSDVYCQVLSIVNEAGEPVNLSFDVGVAEDILAELKHVRQLLEIAFSIDSNIEEWAGD